MAPLAAPDMLIPDVEDVVADSARHDERSGGPGDQTMVLNMGPQHPSTHGVLRLVLEIDGESVVSCAPDIGYLHTGIEKTCEAKFYQQVVPLTDRVDYLSPMTNNLCYCLAVEKLLELEIPERAQWMRVLLNELTRISSHLVWLGTHALDVGALTMFLYCWREREDISADLRERLRAADDELATSASAACRSSHRSTCSNRSRTSSTRCPRASTSTKICSPGIPSGWAASKTSDIFLPPTPSLSG